MKVFLIIIAPILTVGAIFLYFNFGPPRVDQLRSTSASLDNEITQSTSDIQSYKNCKQEPTILNIPSSPDYAYYVGSEGPFDIWNFAGSGTKGVRYNFYYRYRVTNIAGRRIDQTAIWLDYRDSLIDKSIWNNTIDDNKWFSPLFRNNTLFEELYLLTYHNFHDESSSFPKLYIMSYTQVRASDNDVNDAFIEVVNVVNNPSISREEKEEKLHDLENSVGAKLFAEVVRIFPIYDEESKMIRTFDSYTKSVASQQNGDTPFTRDPVKSAIEMFIDPSSDCVKYLLGLN